VSYKDGFKKRNKTIIAEPKCEEWLQKNGVVYTRYGFDALFDIKPQDFMKIPDLIRCTPDFMVIGKNACFIEAKGCSDILRLKHDDLCAYLRWNKICPVYLFVYSTKFKRKALPTISKVNDYINLGHVPTGVYPENNKLYYKIPFENL